MWRKLLHNGRSGRLRSFTQSPPRRLFPDKVTFTVPGHGCVFAGQVGGHHSTHSAAPPTESPSLSANRPGHGTLPSPLLQPSPSPPHPPRASSTRGVAGFVTGRASRCRRVCPPDAPGTCTAGLFFPPQARAPASWPHVELPSLCPPRTRPPSGWEPRPGSAKAESHRRHRVPRQPDHQHPAAASPLPGPETPCPECQPRRPRSPEGESRFALEVPKQL